MGLGLHGRISHIIGTITPCACAVIANKNPTKTIPASDAIDLDLIDFLPIVIGAG
jgi:hypothetical protein